MNDRWDLSYLYKSFEDEAFQRDLKSLPQSIEDVKRSWRMTPSRTCRKWKSSMKSRKR